MKDGSCYEDLYQSALCRAKADWLVGINASRLFSVLYNQNLKVGRVQTPTLAMIVDRNQKIKEFTKEKYYMAHIKFDDMDAVTEHFQKKEDADKVAADCLERMCEVEKDDVKEKTVRPPKLYDLTTLQREANRMFGYTAQQTLDAVQEMYEQKLVTYPRTDSQYLTDEMGESTETLIQMLLGKMPYAEGLEYQPDVSKVLNSKKVSDHHAIIPTVEVAKADIGELARVRVVGLIGIAGNGLRQLLHIGVAVGENLVARFIQTGHGVAVKDKPAHALGEVAVKAHALRIGGISFHGFRAVDLGRGRSPHHVGDHLGVFLADDLGAVAEPHVVILRLVEHGEQRHIRARDVLHQLNRINRFLSHSKRHSQHKDSKGHQ